MWSIGGEVLSVFDVFCGVMFLYAGLAKSFSKSEFVISLRAVPHFPHRATEWGAYVIIGAELAVALALLFALEWGKFLAIALLLAFSAVASLAHIHRQSISCNCFGIDGNSTLSLATAARNLVLAAGLGISVAVAHPQPSVSSTMYGSIALLMYLIAVNEQKNHRDFVALRNGKEV
jgi:hypothetical protein